MSQAPVPPFGSPQDPYTSPGQYPPPGLPPAAVGTSRPAVVWVLLGAGIAGILGSFLPWGTVTAPIVGSMTVSGVDGADGWITAALAAAITAIAGVRAAGRLPAVAGTAAGIVAAGFGLILAAIGGWKIFDLNTRFDELKAQLPAGDDPFGITSALTDAVHVSVGAGLWLLTAAGIVAAVGGVLLTLARPNTPAGPWPTVTPSA